MWVILLFCQSVLVLTFGAKVEQKETPKIINGKNGNIQDYPYVVSLRDAEGDHMCGGTVIDYYHILTAAHCFDRLPAKSVVVGSSYLDQGGQVYPVKKITKNPNYDPRINTNDLAIILVGRRIAYRSAFLPRSRSGIRNWSNPCFIMGWGLNRHYELSNQLQVATVFPVTPEDCRKAWTRVGGSFYNDKLICTTTNRNGECEGDSGGPLVCGNVLQGVISFGEPCATGIPDISTDVHNYNDWIDAVIKRDESFLQQAGGKMRQGYQKVRDPDSVVFPDN